MKKEQIQKRILELLSTKEQLLANANACQGAIQELERILIEIDKDEKDAIINNIVTNDKNYE